MRFLVLGHPEDRRLLLRRLAPSFPNQEWIQVGTAAAFNQALAQGSLDLVIAFYRLPWSRGNLALAAIREHFPALPVILIATPQEAEAAEAACHADHCNWLLRRNLGSLPALVRSCLEQARLEKRCAEMERELTRSEERYRIIAGLAADYAYVLDVPVEGNPTLEWASASFRELAGVQVREQGIDQVANMVYPEDWPLLQEHVARLLAGESGTAEFRVVTGTGAVRWLRAAHQPTWDESQGRVTRIYGGAWDITERHAAAQVLQRALDELETRIQERTADLVQVNQILLQQAEELRAREEFLAEKTDVLERLHVEAQQRANELDVVFHSLVDPVLVNDADGRITRANPAVQETLGLDPLGKDVDGVLTRLSLRREHSGPPLPADRLPSARALAGETVRNERLFLTCARGYEWAVLASAAPLEEDHRPVGAVLALHDITEQEETRALGDLLRHMNTQLMTVARPEEALQQVLAEAAEGLQAEVASLNRHEGKDWVVRHLYGLPEAMLGYRFSDPGGKLESDVAQSQGVLPIDDLGRYGPFGELVAQQYGARSIVIVTLMLWGEATGIMVFGYPAGPRSLTDAELDFARQLSFALSLAQENVRLYEQARQDAESRAILLHEVNHRVKNNLAAIVGLVYAQLDRPEVQEEPACQLVLQDLVRGAENLSIVHDMLAAGEWAPLPLDELTGRVLHTTLQVIPSGHVVIYVRPSSLYVTSAQAHPLALVVSELALNMVKHALAGRETLQVSAAAEQVDDMIVLTIRDNGPGYPADVLSGTRHGAGLQLAKNLVARNLRGRLVLRNEQGAVTEVRFPLVEARPGRS